MEELVELGSREYWVLFCVMSQAVLTALVGLGVMWFCGEAEVPLAIGLGIIAYAVAVAFYTLLALPRRRSAPGV